MMYTKGTSFKIGRQITQHLLCEKCELRFSKNGEDYFAKVAMPTAGQDIPPFLFRILRLSLIPLWNKMGAVRLSLGSGLYPEINSHALYYYALSMFWRGGVPGWSNYQQIEYENGLMDAMKDFLLNGNYIENYFIRVIPSFWTDRYSFVMPRYRKGIPFFNAYMFDFYLEKDCKFSSNRENKSKTPIIYTADSVESVQSHLEITTAINASKRSKNLQTAKNLISW